MHVIIARKPRISAGRQASSQLKDKFIHILEFWMTTLRCEWTQVEVNLSLSFAYI